MIVVQHDAENGTRIEYQLTSKRVRWAIRGGLEIELAAHFAWTGTHKPQNVDARSRNVLDSEIEILSRKIFRHDFNQYNLNIVKSLTSTSKDVMFVTSPG